tara:strand:- start:7013 stop:8227 length:1215 start_codon:yes stop_codon:yes gene_type:complete
MASSTKIVLIKKRNKEGLYPLAIRITKDRRSTYKYIGSYIKLSDWDEKNKLVKSSHPNSIILNKLISSEFKKANKGLIKFQSKHKEVSAFKIKKEIYNSPKKRAFFELAQEHLDELEVANKFSRQSVDRGILSNIAKFNKSRQLPFIEIDEHFLKRLKVYLAKDRSLSESSIMSSLIFIRLLYNRAIKEKIIKRKYYPFGKDKIKIKYPETKKIGLNIEEIKRIEQLIGLTKEEEHARNMWLYSFNFAGMRVSDVLKTRWSDIQNGRLYYTMNKNSKLLSLKIPPKIFVILDQYRMDKRDAKDFIFPEFKKVNINDPYELYVKSKQANKSLNYYLKKLANKAGIDKKLTMHIARHSFGHIAGEKIHPLKLQKLYRHSDLKTTLNYQANFIHADADEALDSVVTF